MDASQYQPNGMNAAYGSLPGISPHQLQQSTNLPAHTLPPLQASNTTAASAYYGSTPHTPRTPATPNTPVSAAAMNNYTQATAQGRNYPLMAANNGLQSAYQQPQQVYRTSASMVPQSTTAMSYPQAIAPAPMQNRMPQALRPMPPNGLQQLQQGMGSPYGSNFAQLPLDEQPTHVVGSQGRRGILPSAPGKPPVQPNAGKGTIIPTKDADGKFPCPHCTKTYLHAKHLKRHLLRHTGDRPYMCVLCRDTFSRSDILKRHFQKCSIRRGNPTGASHLSHAQAHLKKSHPGPHKSNGSISGDSDLVNGMALAGGTGLFGISPDGTVPDAGSNLTEEQAQQLRQQANNLKRLSAGGLNGGSMVGQGPGGSNRASFEQSYAGGIASSMPSGMNPSVAYSFPHGQNGHSYSQGYDLASNGNSNNGHVQNPAGQTWPQTYDLNTPKDFMNPYNNNIANPQVSIKTEPSNISTNGNFSGLYNTHSLPTFGFEKDPVDEISARLIRFCFPVNQITHRSSAIKAYLTPSNIEHFITEFTSFQGHFPIIHPPSFRLSEAWDGLVVGMICTGAVYSNRIPPTQVREMMEVAKMAIERNSPIYANIVREQSGGPQYTIGTGAAELDQITALLLMQMLFTWHGTPIQREKARREFSLLVEIARRAGLTQPLTQNPMSVLHQPNVQVENFNAASFDWSAWIEQEKRSRLMFGIFLTDCAMVIYFNTAPRLEMDEIRLPLPADDAAWDATSASACIDALGLHGPAAAQSSNREGSRRPKQPEMHTALSALMNNIWDLQPGTTNIYSKFVLVHALHVQLWTAYRQTSQDTGLLTPMNPSGTNTPMSQYDFLRNFEPGSGPQSGNNSGTATPNNTNGQASHLFRSINNAFDKWKRAWDDDLITQYPSSSTHHHRFGFCRDAVHFYWLAKYLMKHNRGYDPQTAPDMRFSQTMNLLKSVRAWVASDSAKRGAGLGSMSDVDQNYGVKDLTLDMAQLFKPINRQIDSPVAGVQLSGK